MADDDLSDISSDEDEEIFFDAVASPSGEEMVTEDEVEDGDENYALDDEEYEDKDEWHDAVEELEEEEPFVVGDLQAGMGANFDPTNHYVLHDPIHTFFHRYGAHGITARVEFQNMDQLEDVASTSHGLEPIFDDILRNLLNMAPGGPNDLVGVHITHPRLKQPIIVPFQQRKSVSGAVIARWIERVLQSYEDLDLNELNIKMIVIHYAAGAGVDKLRSNWKAWYDKHSSGHGGFLIPILNTDDALCLARAIVFARARLHPKDHRYQWHKVRRHDQKMAQKSQAQELMELAGLKDHEGSCGIDEAKKIQAVLPDHQIRIYSKEFANCMIYRGEERPNVIHLYHHHNHYTVITSMEGFMGRNYYCEYCDKGYQNREDHRCAKICSDCYSRDPECIENDSAKIYCPDCNRNFRNRNCFDRHKEKKATQKLGKRKRQEVSICDKIKLCPGCATLITEKHKNKKEEHKCGFFDCRTCGEYVEIKDHKCYIRPLGKNDDEDEDEEDEDGGDPEPRGVDKVRYVFFDFEATQETVLTHKAYGPVLEHKVNLCVAHIVCSDCLDNEKLGSCPNCKEGRMVFEGDNCRNNFCEWLFDSADALKKTKTVAIAHNMKGYDGQFILQYLHDQARIPTVVPKGLEIMSISLGKTKIIDSLNFLPSRLADLPKTFGIEELKKGYFPHLFNKVENMNYVGPMPDAMEYSPATMKPADYDKFHKWHLKQVLSHTVFDFRKEFLEYCESDVDILRRCCLAFRKVFMDATGLDPFTEALTIAAACNKVFRTLFLKKHTIGVVPHGGYRKRDKYSIIAVKWLEWVEQTENIKIQHAANGNEASILQYKVDGLCGKTVYEFHGGWWHGCPKCMKRRQQVTADQLTIAEQAYKRTLERTEAIQAAGYTVLEIWECELLKQLKENPDMEEFFDGILIVDPMDPREAFYGGRTNATKLYHKCGPGEKIRYIDVVSLYPWVCKYGEFPLGHPEVITDDFEPITKDNHPYKGLIKATVLPPTDLEHPVIPMHCNGKLLFPLCRSCAQSKEQSQCHHDDDERAITGAWCHMELYKALKEGYMVMEVHEVYHYKEWSVYDPDTRTGGLFADYIDKFLKMKQEADGWPAWCTTEAEKDQYIDDYYEHEGIRLEKAKIAKNPGFRALAKLMLNSFWGKFGQRNNQSQVNYFTEPEPFCETVFDPTKIISSVNFVSDNMAVVTSSQIDDFVQVAGNTNMIIAAYTTAQARLKLYSYIEQLQERVLYFDTDSVVYVSKDQQWEPEIGSYLGMMSNELKDEGAGAYIEEFVSAGPKNYAYKICKYVNNVKKYKYVCKVRGFSLLNYVQKVLNFKSMRRMVHAFVINGCKEEFSIVYNRISRLPIHRNVVTESIAKRYRVVYDKRVVNKDFSTLPYGYVNNNLDALVDNM